MVFTERFKAAGLDLELGSSDVAPGLPIALGGVGTTLETLVTAYAALAAGGAVTPLTQTGGTAPARPDVLFAPGAADAVVDILAGMPPPKGVGVAGRIAFKTGTSFRFRDGWAVGFDGARVIGVWMGRADGGTCACVGTSAATVLFRLFDLLPPQPLAPRSLTPVFAAPPPPALVRLDAAERPRDEDGPHITFPVPDRACSSAATVPRTSGSPPRVASDPIAGWSTASRSRAALSPARRRGGPMASAFRPSRSSTRSAAATRPRSGSSTASRRSVPVFS